MLLCGAVGVAGLVILAFARLRVRGVTATSADASSGNRAGTS
jgi:hypothetical protein